MGRGMFRWTRAAALLLIAAVSVAVPATAGAKKPAKKPSKPKVVGAFYTETNGNPNKLLVFDRYSDGTLKQGHKVATGGQGGHQGQPINVDGPAPSVHGQRGRMSVRSTARTRSRSHPTGSSCSPSTRAATPSARSR